MSRTLVIQFSIADVAGWVLVTSMIRYNNISACRTGSLSPWRLTSITTGRRSKLSLTPAGQNESRNHSGGEWRGRQVRRQTDAQADRKWQGDWKEQKCGRMWGRKINSGNVCPSLSCDERLTGGLSEQRWDWSILIIVIWSSPRNTGKFCLGGGRLLPVCGSFLSGQVVFLFTTPVS